MRRYLINKKGFLPENITFLRDDKEKPTRDIILKELNNFINKCNNDISCNEAFFHYSGHGAYIGDASRDEADGRDEVLVAQDLKFISDDELRTIFKNINSRVQLNCLLDCCHSATILDLPFVFTSSSTKTVLASDQSSKYKEYNNTKIFMISGCLDNQTSADAYKIYAVDNDPNNTIPDDYQIFSTNTAGGALTAVVLLILNSNNKILFHEILPLVHQILRNNRFTQFPQLSSSFNFLAPPPPAPVPIKPTVIRPTSAPVKPSTPAKPTPAKPTATKPTPAKPVGKPVNKPIVRKEIARPLVGKPVVFRRK
jgi:cell division septation protein DedD